MAILRCCISLLLMATVITGELKQSSSSVSGPPSNSFTTLSKLHRDNGGKLEVVADRMNSSYDLLPPPLRSKYNMATGKFGLAVGGSQTIRHSTTTQEKTIRDFAILQNYGIVYDSIPSVKSLGEFCDLFYNLSLVPAGLSDSVIPSKFSKRISTVFSYDSNVYINVQESARTHYASSSVMPLIKLKGTSLWSSGKCDNAKHSYSMHRIFRLNIVLDSKTDKTNLPTVFIIRLWTWHHVIQKYFAGYYEMIHYKQIQQNGKNNEEGKLIYFFNLSEIIGMDLNKTINSGSSSLANGVIMAKDKLPKNLIYKDNIINDKLFRHSIAIEYYKYFKELEAASGIIFDKPFNNVDIVRNNVDRNVLWVGYRKIIKRDEVLHVLTRTNLKNLKKHGKEDVLFIKGRFVDTKHPEEFHWRISAQEKDFQYYSSHLNFILKCHFNGDLPKRLENSMVVEINSEYCLADFDVGYKWLRKVNHQEHSLTLDYPLQLSAEQFKGLWYVVYNEGKTSKTFQLKQRAMEEKNEWFLTSPLERAKLEHPLESAEARFYRNTLYFVDK